MRFQFANRASAPLAAPVTVDSTSITVAAGNGDRFPATTVDLPAQLTIVDASGASEVVQCWQRAGDVMQVYRGQEGTAVIAFPVGALVELRLTAATINSFLPLGGGTMAGDVAMAGHTIHNAILDGSPYIDNVKTHGVFPTDGVFGAAIELLAGGVVPRINGNSILTTIMLHSAVFLWWGRIDQLPPWLKICDGTVGTPDLRNRFPLGAIGDSDIGEYGGQFDVSTGPAGGHNHANANVGPGSTWDQNLNSGNLPGLTAPTVNQTKVALLKQSLSANFPNDPKFDVVTNVSISGGGTYSGNAAHAHGINYDGVHGHSVSIRPPYFKLHYVMWRSMQIN